MEKQEDGSPGDMLFPNSIVRATSLYNFNLPTSTWISFLLQNASDLNPKQIILEFKTII